MNTAAATRRNGLRHAVEIIAFVLLMFGAATATGIVLSAVVLLLSGEAQAAEVPPAETRQGTLLLRGKDGKGSFPAPLLDTEVVLKVSGIITRAEVRQIFRNPHPEWLEGIYVFPLPENAAVDHLRMRIGRRVIEGEIREREAAKAIYAQAKDAGQRATLVEQERPNIFTTSVANIGPGEDIVVEIEYQQTLRYDQGEFSLRFPMVVGPRYIPGSAEVGGEPGSGRAPNTDAVPDAARITPPVPKAAPGDLPLNPVRIRVELDAGVPIGKLESPYHAIHVQSPDPSRRLIELAAGATPANRDFELKWVPAAQAQPQPALFTERKDGRHYALLMLLPPAGTAAGVRLPRETVFVIDTSGSMDGTSIVQAREALQLALDRLGPRDRFNIIEFNSYPTPLYRDAQPADETNLAQARRFVSGLRAQGGTEMAGALDLALDNSEDPQRVRQVIFLTDGAVGNEDQLFRLIEEQLGDTRLFTVGIGSAPNGWFMTKAAEAGRGTYTYIGKVEEVKEKMAALFAKLESPVLKGVQVEWPRADVEQWPKRLPDLYLGEPLMVSAALDSLQGEVKLAGQLGDRTWQARVDLAAAAPAEGPGVLWARKKIGALTDGLREGRSEADVRAEVVELALVHHLVSKYTSLVAVDRTPARPLDQGLNSGALPTDLPEGWNHESVFGELPRGATDARFNLLLGLLALMAGSLLWLRRRQLEGGL